MSTVVTFGRIGRRHDVPSLTVNSDDPEVVAEAVHRHASRYLGSRWYEVTVDAEAGRVFIEGGRFGGGSAVSRD